MQMWNTEIGRRTLEESQSRPLFVDLTEVMVPPRSNLIGKTLSEIRFRDKYGISGVALWRGSRSFRTDVGKMPLEVGDALLMVGTPQQINALAYDTDFTVLQSGHAQRPLKQSKALLALAITGVVLTISIFQWLPTSIAMLIGVAAMALTRVIDLEEAYRSVEWRVIFLIAGILPISIAMANTGLAERIGNLWTESLPQFGTFPFIASAFFLTVIVTQLIGGQVAGLIVGPVAITSALQLGVNPQAFAVSVAIASSTAFLTPIAHPVNLLMMAPGGYKPSDFLKIGVIMTFIVFLGLMIGMIVFWEV